MIFGMEPVEPDKLLGLFEDHVRKFLGLSTETCFLSVADEDTHLGVPPADRFVTIFPEAFPVWQSVVAGAGREFGTGYDAMIRMVAYTRLQVDQEMRSSQLIRSAALGLINTANRMANVAQFWVPLVHSNNIAATPQCYLREPARMTRGPSFRPRHVRKEVWSLCTIQVEAKFTAKFTKETIPTLEGDTT